MDVDLDFMLPDLTDLVTELGEETADEQVWLPRRACKECWHTEPDNCSAAGACPKAAQNRAGSHNSAAAVKVAPGSCCRAGQTSFWSASLTQGPLCSRLLALTQAPQQARLCISPCCAAGLVGAPC